MYVNVLHKLDGITKMETIFIRVKVKMENHLWRVACL